MNKIVNYTITLLLLSIILTKVKHTYANITSECVQLNLFNKKISTRYTFECLSTLRSSKGPFEHEHLSLKLPFTNNPNMWFAHEISQSINRESLQSPPLAISWQNHHSHWFLTKIRNYRSIMTIYITKRYLKNNLEVFNLL